MENHGFEDYTGPDKPLKRRVIDFFIRFSSKVRVIRFRLLRMFKRF